MALNDILKEAKKMQETMEQIQGELKEAEVVITKAGAVKVKSNGMNEILAIKIHPEFLKEERAVIEKTVLEAIQEALGKSKTMHEEKIKQLTSSFSIPGFM